MPRMCLSERLREDRRALCSYGSADGHEEAEGRTVSRYSRGDMFDVPYPNVAAEPSMYWPSVRSIPLGPGPNLMMFVAPKMKPMIKPTAVIDQM